MRFVVADVRVVDVLIGSGLKYRHYAPSAPATLFFEHATMQQQILSAVHDALAQSQLVGVVSTHSFNYPVRTLRFKLQFAFLLIEFHSNTRN
jgi:hypothetical protein